LRFLWGGGMGLGGKYAGYFVALSLLHLKNQAIFTEQQVTVNIQHIVPLAINGAQWEERPG
jgi:hypothetical protein